MFSLAPLFLTLFTCLALVFLEGVSSFPVLSQASVATRALRPAQAAWAIAVLAPLATLAGMPILLRVGSGLFTTETDVILPLSATCFALFFVLFHWLKEAPASPVDALFSSLIGAGLGHPLDLKPLIGGLLMPLSTAALSISALVLIYRHSRDIPARQLHKNYKQLQPIYTLLFGAAWAATALPLSSGVILLALHASHIVPSLSETVALGLLVACVGGLGVIYAPQNPPPPSTLKPVQGFVVDGSMSWILAFVAALGLPVSVFRLLSTARLGVARVALLEKTVWGPMPSFLGLLRHDAICVLGGYILYQLLLVVFL